SVGARRDGARSPAGGRRGRDRHAGHRVRGDRPLMQHSNDTPADGYPARPVSGAPTGGPPVQLSAHLRAEIDHWVAKFPPGRQRSAVISALREAQHENGGYLTQPLMDAIAAYLKLPAIQVYEVATFY